MIDNITHLHHDLTETTKKRDNLQTQRDQAIRDAIANGVTMYAIAKALGISQTAVARIRDRN